MIAYIDDNKESCIGFLLLIESVLLFGDRNSELNIVYLSAVSPLREFFLLKKPFSINQTFTLSFHNKVFHRAMIFLSDASKPM